MKLVGWVGDVIADWHLELFSDADLASDLLTRRSTSGVHATERCVEEAVMRLTQYA